MKLGQELAGRYRLAERLGRGAMGEVWRATDLRLEREVAVKVMLANWTGEAVDTALTRFRREGKAAARLNHPKIATVHDTGVHDGQLFLVLELLKGPDLAALLRGHPGGLPIAMVLEYGAQAAEGLAAAHTARVIHRDIKPSNLMLAGNGTLKICDFGIARLGGATAGLSATGAGIGTLAYMPPEQLLGEPVTGAADVYALGATLFHLLTGHLLFPADDLRAITGQILHKNPPPPSSLRPAIPQALDTYLLTLLAKDPSARPAADTVAARLRALTTDEPRADVLLADAENLARAVPDMIAGTPHVQAGILAEIARVVGVRDPVRARELIAEAEQLAHSTRFGERKFEIGELQRIQIKALAKVARAALEWNPARAGQVIVDAERLARAIPSIREQGAAMRGLARLIEEREPYEAFLLTSGYETTVRLIRDFHTDADERRELAGLLAVHNPSFAVSEARTIRDPYLQAEALVEIAKVVNRRDPAQAKALLSDALTLARTISDPYQQIETLCRIATAAAERDPAQAKALLSDALRLAPIPYRSADPSRELCTIAKALAALDPAAAERLARTISNPYLQAEALVEIAKVLIEQRTR
ncbi:serine/threonine-protein kinase [Nonomuraea sediminis]|uniref:serine/threonine-protein kinase n=1 Tax=Nonomuraea sediminis TaxID=2835864 RepID=UPI001BDBE1E0|nr:serine/threonine-protein kinase [Nonomuraea sediminis]